MKKVDYKSIGLRIKEKRTKLGITQEKLAEKISVSPSYISEIERGSSICSLQVLIDIADILELNLDYLVNDVNITNIDFSLKDILKDIPEKNQSLYISICKNIAKSFK